MRCPSCGSDSCFPITETKTEGVDVTSSCCRIYTFWANWRFMWTL